jgi:glutamate dehydrogenase (NADP+)
MAGITRSLRIAIDGTYTGKYTHTGGSLARKEATGYGLGYIVQRALTEKKNTSFEEKKS